MFYLVFGGSIPGSTPGAPQGSAEASSRVPRLAAAGGSAPGAWRPILGQHSAAQGTESSSVVSTWALKGLLYQKVWTMMTMMVLGAFGYLVTTFEMYV